MNIHTKTFTNIFIVALFVIAKNWGKSKYQQVNIQANGDISIQWNTFQ